MNNRQAKVLVATIAAFAILALAGLAWACTPQTRMFGITPLTAPQRSPVEITGKAVQTDTVVEVRWNSATGPKLGEVVADASGNFSTKVNIPDAAPGVYYVMAVSPGSDGSQNAVARIAFEVTGSPTPGTQAASTQPSSSSTELWSGFNASATEPSVGTQAPADTSGSGLAAGLGLVAAGSVALVTTVTVILRRKTRTPA